MGHTSTVRPWLQLFRVPNLFTVPGDPVAGFFLAGGAVFAQATDLAAACGVGLSLYAAGLVLNDLVDEQTDRTERPGRPLPSGGVRRPHAFAACVGLFATAGALSILCGGATPAVTAVLALAVLAYNLWSKRVPVLGELNMASCRALSLLVGVSAAGTVPYVPYLALGIASVFLYVTSVTIVARFEADEDRAGAGIWAPLLVTGFLCAFIALPTFYAEHPNRITGLVAAVLWVLTVSTAYLKVSKTEPERRTEAVPPAIGVFLRGLVPLQAWLIAASGMPGSAMGSALILSLFIPATLMGRYFYGS
jgi:4-hydroxybenzoate polyprenyltransferase